MRKTKDPIRLRRRAVANGNTSLYLDIYVDGKRSYEYLRLYLVPEKNAGDRQKNRETLRLAEAIRAKRLVDLQNGRFGFSGGSSHSDIAVADYIQAVVDGKKTLDTRSYGSYASMLTHFRIFCGHGKPTFKDLTEEFAGAFADYLRTARRLNTHKGCRPSDNKDMPQLGQNARHLYWVKFKSVLNKAVKDKIIDRNPCSFVGGVGHEEVERVFLTVDELRRMTGVECRNPVAKRAFLFSCLTGLRKSDIEKLTWGEVSQVDGFWRITFRQKKTGGLVYLDITDEARSFMGERGDGKDTDLVFSGFYYSDKMNFAIREWAAAAEVRKHLTFHSARHTFALLLLDQSTDIYTVSKLLGHTDVRTTMRYAHILDQKKRDAVLSLPKIKIEK